MPLNILQCAGRPHDKELSGPKCHKFKVEKPYSRVRFHSKHSPHSQWVHDLNRFRKCSSRLWQQTTESSAWYPHFISEAIPPAPRKRPPTSLSTHTSNSTTAVTHLAERRTLVQMPTHLWTNQLSSDLLFNSLGQLKALGISPLWQPHHPNISYHHTHIKPQSPSQAQLATLWLMLGQWQLPSYQ